MQLNQPITDKQFSPGFQVGLHNPGPGSNLDIWVSLAWEFGDNLDSDRPINNFELLDAKN